MSIIVSLTTTSIRLDVLKYTLLSLSKQSLKADKVILNISKDAYLIDKGVQKLPFWLDRLESLEEITINWVENTGPYRKLMPVYNQADDNDWIVTCDDDVIYGEYWLESLVKTATNNPEAIVCGRARLPEKGLLGKNQSYLNWRLVSPGSSGYDLLPIGIAGVLYRKTLLDDFVMKSEEFKQLAPKQDDLWFNLARQVARTKVVVCADADKNVFPIEAPGALSSTNASASVKGWENLFGALWSRLALKTRAYFGFTACDNDIAIKKISDYKKKLQSPAN